MSALPGQISHLSASRMQSANDNRRDVVPWTSPDAPAWKRILAWSVIGGVSVVLLAAMFAQPAVWLLRALGA
ncbi:hypothetical protein ABLE91_16735 [Aquabacter sp. CN5-332]|uniref:hypothetical protein n=1 Tax=Aquabacter sp. CN5-332 TaxID=3156608 RepID=UPI0032B3F55E